MQNFRNKGDLIIRLVAEKLSEKFGKELVIQSAENLGGGCINHASKLETNVGDFFLKWNANCAHDIFLREAESLIELKRASGDYLKVPMVFAAKEVNSSPGFLVLEYLKPRGSTTNDEEKLGKGLGMMHRYSNPKFGFYQNNYCGATFQSNLWKSNWVQFYKNNRLLFLLKHIENKWPLLATEQKVFEKFLDKLPGLIPEDGLPALIHGDLWSGNYMITEDGPALIDPASYFANREMEFGMITLFGGFSQRFFDAYNEVYCLPADWKSRNSLYQLYHILNHYYLFGGSYLQQALQIAKGYL